MAASMDAANPMGRIGDVDADIAPVVLFLASDESRYITSNTLFDGGPYQRGRLGARAAGGLNSGPGMQPCPDHRHRASAIENAYFMLFK